MIRYPVILRRSLLALACLFAPTVGDVTPLKAQSYPARSIKLVVPFGPGGPTDVSARIVAQVVQSGLGLSVVIENRPGAGGAIGTKSVANADPDGGTLLIGTSATLGVVPALMKNPGYDPLKSFAPAAKVADSTLVLVVPASLPATSVQEFVAYAKANPGKLSFASAGVGNQTQLLAELFKSKAGLDIVHVPYKSGAEMVTAILGEQVQMAFPDVSILIPLIREGKLKALAVTSAKRHPQLPDVPTMIESGIPDYIMTFWSGVVAPAGTPAEIVDRLNTAINDGLTSAAVRDNLAKVGAEASPGSPQDFAAFIAAKPGSGAQWPRWPASAWTDRRAIRLVLERAFIQRRALSERLAQLRLELSIDQHERNHARCAGAVAPGMIRAALNHDVAGAELDVDIVQHPGALAGKHDRAIDGLGSMHERMTPALAEGCGLLVAERRKGRTRCLGIHLPHRFIFRREMIDAQHGAALVRHLPPWTQRGLGRGPHDTRRRLLGSPNIGRIPVRVDGVAVHERRGPVGDHDRLAVRVVTSDHSSDLLGHRHPLPAIFDWLFGRTAAPVFARLKRVS
jgi:tripartite-type tricarboxylate transporter receptor subunit TctC